MKKWMSVILGTVMTVMCMMIMTMSAFAAEDPGVSIPVTVSLSGTLPKPEEEFVIKLKADNASYPMPEEAAGGIYTMTITGADTKKLPTISYNRVGVYTYTIYQVAGTNKKCTYDDIVYALKVYISNAEDGSGLEATAVLYPDSESNKLSGAEFKNVYETVKPAPKKPASTSTTTTTPKTGDESNPILYAVLVAVSFGIIVLLFLTRKNRKKEEN